VGVPKLPKLRLLQLWGPITLCADVRLKWGVKQSWSHFQDLSNSMLHTTYTQGNQVDSQLLMVRSQTTNLTPGPSFDHNVCFKCPNQWCKPILDIKVSIAFQWYKEFLEPLSFDPYNRSLNIRESIETLTPKVEAPLGMWGFIPSHFPSLPSFPLGPQPCKPLPWLRAQGEGYDILSTNEMFLGFRLIWC